MSGRLIEEDLFTKYSIVDSRLPEGQKIHDFLAVRAKALAGKYIDFDKTPAAFVLSDSDQPNAFYAPAPDPDPEKQPRRDEYETIRYNKNPLDTPVICVTRGLIEMVDNLDQLDYVLGHELTHMIMRQHKIEHNSKGEEELANLHSVDLMYDAGGDPKQALLMAEKISAYAEKEKEKQQQRRRYRSHREKGIDWSRILDVHMTDKNQKAGLEASLTRLSHLIDDKKPTAIDKTTFDVRYNDPIDRFLKENNYEGRKPLGKLKLLVDSVDHLSGHVPAEEFFQAELDSLPKKDDEDFDYMTARKRERLQEQIDAGYTDYFSGLLIEKKYQQKIANLAEGVISQVQEERQQKGTPHKPAVINAQDLNIYLQNKAYPHITANGYPVAGDFNYLNASGVLYSYFYSLLKENSPRAERYDDEENEARKLSQIEIDINNEKEKIKTAKTAEEFMQAADQHKRLSNILVDIRETSYGENGRGQKLDNLSSISGYGTAWLRKNNDIYDDLEGGEAVPWNNLVEIVKADEKSKEHILAFLEQKNIEDFRITHSLPYIRTGRYDCYSVTDEGKTSDKKIEEYELDFAVNREVVLQAYDYVRAYFNNEAALIDATCATALNVDDQDFKEFETITEMFNENSIADKKFYDFISLFNALPDNNKEDRYRENQNAIALIPKHHQKDYPIPGYKEVGSEYRKSMVCEFSRDLFEFDNPIFQKHFGEDFEKQLIAQKNAQQQKMFEAAFALFKKSVDIWLDAEPKFEYLEKRHNRLGREIWKSSNESQKKTKEEEWELLGKRLNFYKGKKDTARSLVYNVLGSIFENSLTNWQLHRLTSEQKRMLADFAVRDEKGAVVTIFQAEGYERFCDYLDVLEEQTEKVISGDYELTEMMKVVANNHGYKSANTKETLKEFVDKDKVSKYSSDNKKYGWYLHVFDAMQYLERTPEINISSLALALTEIEQTDRSNRGSDDQKIVTARYQNYNKFIAQSNIVDLVSRAVGYQENYKNLSCGELLETADNLIAMRSQMAKVFSGESDYNFSSKRKLKMKPEHEKFLNIADKNIRGALIRAENQALQKDNSLEKITDLYRIYNAHREYYSRDSARGPYLKEMDEKEDRLKNISTLSEDESFWPEDTLDHVKAFVFAQNTFLDDKEFEDKLLNNILDKLENMPSGKKKNECLFVLLDQNLRAAYPETRDRLFAIYVDEVSRKLGKDDGSERYQKRLVLYLKALEIKKEERDKKERDWDIGKAHGHKDGLLSNSMGLADKYLLMRRLSDAIISQEQTSQMMKESCQIKLNSDDMLMSYLYGIGVDYLTEEMDRDPEMANRFIQFFNSKGEKKDCEEISSYIETSAKKRYSGRDKIRLDEILKHTRPSNCKILYENFWSAPLEARAVIIARMLKSAVNGKNGEQNHAQHSWEQVFDIVMDNIIRPDDNSIEAKYARDIMHSYIKSRSNYERELIMSAMMVANRNIGSDAGNVGKALKLFLENMGPAEIKLGQAIASHPNTPESIRVELQELKNNADKPARWTLYDWIRAENIPVEFWKDVYLGEIRGSASYYTTVDLGEDDLLRILRPEAREKASKGFRVIRSTVDDLKTKEVTSDISYRELTASVQEMVTQAARMSEIETDHEIGQQQCEDAKDIYNGIAISSSRAVFFLKVMDWRAKGQNWIKMRRAKGPTFNDFPEDTLEQIAYKKRFAKGYIAFEIMNILSGKKFDHDKHGAQLSIDDETNEAGIYDTGAMALRDPTSEEQRLLGNVIYDTVKDAMKKEQDNLFASFSHVMSKKIEELHQAGIDTQYLVEVKKGLLALGDFFKILDQEDIKDILPSINLSTDVSKDIHHGITEKMSLFERTYMKTFLETQSTQVKTDIVIRRESKEQNTPSNVVNITVDSTIQSKSSWLQNAFTKPDDDDESPEISPFIPANDRLPHTQSQFVIH